MLVLKHHNTSENMEFKNSTELKDFLKMQNPTILKRYKDQLKHLHPDLVVDGIGAAIRIYKK
jgi:hypothetical protein